MSPDSSSQMMMMMDMTMLMMMMTRTRSKFVPLELCHRYVIASFQPWSRATPFLRLWQFQKICLNSCCHLQKLYTSETADFIWKEVMIWFCGAPFSISLGQFTGEIHNSCFMRLGTNLTEKLGANGSKMSSRRMGSSKMAARPVYTAFVQVFNVRLY